VLLRELCPNVSVCLATRDDESAIVMTSAPKGGAVHAGDWAKVIRVVFECGFPSFVCVCVFFFFFCVY
jgi:hypothetical protein